LLIYGAPESSKYDGTEQRNVRTQKAELTFGMMMEFPHIAAHRFRLTGQSRVCRMFCAAFEQAVSTLPVMFKHDTVKNRRNKIQAQNLFPVCGSAVGVA